MIVIRAVKGWDILDVLARLSDTLPCNVCESSLPSGMRYSIHGQWQSYGAGDCQDYMTVRIKIHRSAFMPMLLMHHCHFVYSSPCLR